MSVRAPPLASLLRRPLAARASPCALAGRWPLLRLGRRRRASCRRGGSPPSPPASPCRAPSPPAPVGRWRAPYAVVYPGGLGARSRALLPSVAVVAAGAAPCLAARWAGGSARCALLRALRALPRRVRARFAARPRRLVAALRAAPSCAARAFGYEGGLLPAFPSVSFRASCRPIPASRATGPLRSDPRLAAGIV